MTRREKGRRRLDAMIEDAYRRRYIRKPKRAAYEVSRYRSLIAACRAKVDGIEGMEETPNAA